VHGFEQLRNELLQHLLILDLDLLLVSDMLQQLLNNLFELLQLME
jgi:hypothetical protein